MYSMLAGGKCYWGGGWREHGAEGRGRLLLGRKAHFILFIFLSYLYC